MKKKAWQAGLAALDRLYRNIANNVPIRENAPMKTHLVNLALGLAAGLVFSAALYGPMILGAF